MHVSRDSGSGRFTIEVEDQTGQGGHFVLKELANRLTANTVEATLENSSPAIASLFRDVPAFSSNFHGDGSGILLAEVPPGRPHVSQNRPRGAGPEFRSAD